jgi:ATP-dependent Clp protease ATP-binding subunit ClpC
MKKVADKVKRILNMSLKQAKLYDDWEVKIEHIMIALINDYNNNAIRTLEDMDVDIDILHKKIEKSLVKNKKEDEMYDINNDTIPLNTTSQNIIKGAEKECDLLKEDYLDTQHILLSLLKTKNSISGILKNMKITYKACNSQVKKTIIESSVEPLDTDGDKPFKGYKNQPKVKTKSNETPVLDNFSVDITKMAIDGRIDPVIGRDKTIQRVAQILARKKKNNPVIIGEPGVGKTTIVEGLALKIVNGEAPRTLLNKRIVSLDLASLVAGTKYRGQFEERIKGVVDELMTVDNVILFLDEVHTIIGAGNSSGSMDAANVLKPALSRGDLQLIGATTLDEFRENIEKDGALTRRFQQVIIEPPSVKDTIEILNKIKFSYESFHKVTYPQETIDRCVKLADRYITDREFPDKAIDIMDEVGSRSQVNAKPPENISKLEDKIIDIKEDKNNVVKSQRYEEAARLRDEERIVTEKLESEKSKWNDNLDKKRKIIDPEEVNEVVSIMTGIPLNRLSGNQGKRLLQMEKDLHGSVIGQDEGLIKIAQSLRRNRVGIRNPKKPIGSFMFIGPTGVGKTHMAKKLAEYMFGDEDSLIRMDMSEFQEKHSISRLIGSPPGYVGHEDGGQLTEKVRRKPYSIILFDEIEKANKEIYNILLQLLDDGQLTDSLGRKVNFKNCMVIMTSNIGVKKLQDFGTGIGFGTKSMVEGESAAKSDILMDELKKHFAPEFLNRLDDVVIFKSLTKEEIGKIVDLEIISLKGRVEEIGYGLQINKTVKDYLIENGYDKEYGARPLNRAIQKYVEDPVSEEILKGKVKEGQTIKVSYVKSKEKIVIKVE